MMDAMVALALVDMVLGLDVGTAVELPPGVALPMKHLLPVPEPPPPQTQQ